MTEKKTEEKSKTLIQKIIAAVDSIGPVTKDGKNNFSHYDYTTDGQVTACIRGLLKQGVWFIPNYEIIERWSEQNGKGKTNNFVQVQGHFTLTDGVDSYNGTMPGIGADTLDKAVYKAETGAKKNFFMQLLALTTEDTDDDHGKGLDSNPQNRSNNQSRRPQSRPSTYQRPQGKSAPQAKINMVVKLIATYAKLTDKDESETIMASARKAHVNDLTQLNEPQVDEMIKGYTQAIEMLNKREGAK